MQEQSNTPARRMAYTIIFILMLGAGVAASFTVAGNTGTGLAICGGAIAFSVVVLVIGGFVVASNQSVDAPDD